MSKPRRFLAPEDVVLPEWTRVVAVDKKADCYVGECSKCEDKEFSLYERWGLTPDVWHTAVRWKAGAYQALSAHLRDAHDLELSDSGVYVGQE